MSDADPLQPWLERWRLTPDGPSFSTEIGSLLMPVIAGGGPAMLKIAGGVEERRGGALMEWWGGEGAARVLAREGDALLLERATGTASLQAMALEGQDDAATAILCQVAAGLHAPRGRSPPDSLVPLPIWFRQLEPAAKARGGVFVKSAAVARELLADPRDVAVLHGDLHHNNVLDAGERGWIAIDPKGLIGERGFDFANIFHNPTREFSLAPGRLHRLIGIVAELAGLEPVRLIKWILAYSGLNAAWCLDSGYDAHAKRSMEVAELAATELALISG
ncbi:MAG TPA: aminoglycoside phosphotransferase family protein [Caulobacteraceae bacterium]|jgi:streptomycin 6-kinase